MDAPKAISVSGGWSKAEAPDRSTSITLPLDIAGATQEGLFLLGRALIDRPTDNVSFTLAYQPGESKRKRVLLARVDWRPAGYHMNNKGPAQWIGVRIYGTHIHGFRLNWIAAEERPRKWLPIALPGDPDFDTFALMRDGVGREFNIINPDAIPEPDWNRDLFS